MNLTEIKETLTEVLKDTGLSAGNRKRIEQLLKKKVIIVHRRPATVYKDGGSATLTVINTVETGFKTIFLDGGISSPTRGQYFTDHTRTVKITDKVVCQ